MRLRRRQRGFTLVELMISLVMGLIIALAAVGLARTATTTFYEQARMSGVEANVRTASERLRNDLSRVAFMSTPNIQWDPKIARVPGTAGGPYRVPDLVNLQGLKIAGGAARSHALEVKNGLKPHEIHIAGNLTSDDVYRGTFISSAGGLGCGSARVQINASADAAVRRLFNGATTEDQRVEMTKIVFMPGEVVTPPADPAGKEYAVQVMDMRGCFHYLKICGVGPGAVANTVDLVLAGGILTTEDTKGDVCGARVMEEVAIAPIQRVRWSLGPETDTRRIDTVTEGAGAPNKLNLYRQLMAADGQTPAGPPEVIAEYAVDLKLGLVANTANPPAAPVFDNVDFEADDNKFFTEWASDASLSTMARGPHRIRSVRYRMAFRAPLPDRKADLLMPSGPPYISRYCMGDPCTDYARVRTVISEVFLFNQAKADYQ